MQEYNRQYWEEMYGMPTSELPWEITEAPAELREYMEANRVKGGWALDAGCGTGNFSVFLAKNGFRVVGVDYSQKAIEIAKERNLQARLPITYVRADLTHLNEAVPASQFDFILDYKVAHHLPADKLAVYVGQCLELLKPGSKILLICYSDKDIDAAGSTSAIGKFGNEMFYRTAAEIREVYKAFKEISYKEVMLGKRLNHAGHCFVFEKP
jgi:2-polyprenyl-3-methyl-5-hydroxy-6-metoxy-1,4-benzoquinol methylase